METLKNKIKESRQEHASIPFWSWNDRLEENELRRQIQNMKDLGMRGFFMHARGGLETKYLSDEWFHAVNVCIEEAKRLDMEAWAYDENGWPSGFAGGELLKDEKNHACGLTCEKTDAYPDPCENILGVYVIDKTGAKRVAQDCGASEYTVIRRVRDFSYVDTMSAEVTKKFIAATHERYKKQVPAEDFGSVMPGFFTDEPQYFRYGTPWSDTFLKEFPERFEYDVLDALPALFLDFEEAKEYRYDYRLFCHEKFYSDFMKPLYEWCDNNGIKLTGHGIEEWGLDWQMKCCGGIMPFYLYQHIPGIDFLGRDMRNIVGAKQLGSVCAQTGKKRALSEMFACCGWDVTPRELKRIAELQFAGGVNLICEHLYPYSERGQRKNDYPNHYSEHNPWQKHYKKFENYFTNLGATLSQGKEIADTLVIHPIHSAYLDYFYGQPESVKELNDALNELADKFAFEHIPYHFGDEKIMKQYAIVDGAKINVGECTYDKVVIPHCHTLDYSTVELLKAYISNGGKVYLYGKAPERIDGRIADMTWLKSNITFEQMKADSCVSINAPLYLQMRETEYGRLLFITNVTGKCYPRTEIKLAKCQSLVSLDMNTLEYSPVFGRQNADGSVSVYIDFGDSQSYVLVESNIPMLAPVIQSEKQYIKLPKTWNINALPENMLILDTASITLNGERFSEVRPIVRIKNNLYTERFEGTVTLRFSVNVQSVPQTALLVCEPMRYISVSVNNMPVVFDEQWRFDRQFKVADIAHILGKGINEIDMSFEYFQRKDVYDVLCGGGNEALRNCLSFDTEIEPIYIYGDFGVCSMSEYKETDEGRCLRTDGPFSVCERKSTVNLDCINKDGYTFFAGEMTINIALEWHKGEPTAIKLCGRFATVSANINGHDLGTNMFGDEFELEDFLHEGKNKLTLTLCFSNRNLLGPHHRKISEPLNVSPRIFSFEKMWQGHLCDDFMSDYAFVKFGI